MPTLRLETNIPQSKLPKDLSSKLSEVVSKSLGKPANYVVVMVTGDVDIVWGGTVEPAAIVSLISIGALGAEENKKHSKAILDVISQSIGIASDRLYINFIDAAPETIGYKGTTFAELLKK